MIQHFSSTGGSTQGDRSMKDAWDCLHPLEYTFFWVSLDSTSVWEMGCSKVGSLLGYKFPSAIHSLFCASHLDSGPDCLSFQWLLIKDSNKKSLLNCKLNSFQAASYLIIS